MWQFLIYVVIMVVFVYLFYRNGYDFWASLLNASIIGLIFLTISVGVNPGDIIGGDQGVALTYVIIMLTGVYIITYAVYRANADYLLISDSIE
jgi:hypothetical protein